MRKIFHFDSPSDQYVADAAVLCCFDHRINTVVRKFLKKQNIERCDMIVVAGGAKIPVRFAAASREWTDYEVIMPWAGPNSYQPWMPAVDEQFRRAGITTLARPDRNFKLIASAGADRKLKLWDAITGTPLGEMTGHTDIVYAVEFSPDGSLVVYRTSADGCQLRDPDWYFANPREPRLRVGDSWCYPRAPCLRSSSTSASTMSFTRACTPSRTL